MARYLPEIAEREALYGISADEAAELCASDARRFPRRPDLNLQAAIRNARMVTAQCRYVLSEKPASSFMGRDLSAYVDEWQAELNAWMAVQRLARSLIRECEAAQPVLEAPRLAA